MHKHLDIVRRDMFWNSTRMESARVCFIIISASLMSEKGEERLASIEIRSDFHLLTHNLHLQLSFNG